MVFRRSELARDQGGGSPEWPWWAEAHPTAQNRVFRCSGSPASWLLRLRWAPGRGLAIYASPPKPWLFVGASLLAIREVRPPEWPRWAEAHPTAQNSVFRCGGSPDRQHAGSYRLHCGAWSWPHRLFIADAMAFRRSELARDLGGSACLSGHGGLKPTLRRRTEFSVAPDRQQAGSYGLDRCSAERTVLVARVNVAAR